MDKSPLFFEEREIQGWKVRLAMLCQSCPVHSRHPEHCPLNEVARLRVGQQIDFIKTLPADALRYVLARHEICMESELEKILQPALVNSNADPGTFEESVQAARS